ncbi:hypothetical protein V5O48_011305 [Marasmius crinis-equi]|uniref:THO complex subunit 1 n=1 Tax=Marasmius crinis-equi TaxID=585013 RepID=A0ABR3F6D3_9AGAR
MSLVSLQPALARLVSTVSSSPVDKEQLEQLVRKALDDTKGTSSLENRKSQWEFLLKNEVLNLAATEGKALKEEETKYYDHLRDILDIVLTFTEFDACDQSFPFTVLQDLLEAQTIVSCSHIFTWIETRAARLTEGMVPQKGKALVLLRTLNDLLRRLSKMGNNTIFCGRILTFLSGVFPLGERSGVNLRGEYGPTWEGVKIEVKEEEKELKSGDETTVEEGDDDTKMQVDEKPKKQDTAAEQKIEFYNTFWSLQLPFSKPAVFASPNAFPEFKDAVMKVLPVIKEANAKERLMMGSKGVAASNGSLKRKREDTEDAEDAVEEYFFAKFLTNPDLLDLGIADSYFRRQFLFQLLILLSHLLSFTKTAKAAWLTTRNRSLQMDFTLSDTDAQWAQETFNKAMEELRQTAPNGRTFAETAAIILERDKNWIRWKNELCAPFDKEPWGVEVEEEVEVDGKKGKKKRRVGLEEATRGIREKMREPPEEWKWKFGSESLTEVWEMGYRDLEDLQNPFHPGDVRDFAKKIALEDRRIEMRMKFLKQQQERREAMRAAAAAKAAAAEAEAKPPVIVEPQPQPAVAEAVANLVQSSASPLHPSLPAKPVSGTQTRPLTPKPQAQDASSTPVPNVPPASTPGPSAPSVTGTPAPAPATPVPAPLPPDDQIKRHEESKERWSWLALRTAREQHLSLFGKIGTGDVQMLVQEIEKEREEKEKEKEKEAKEGSKASESPSPMKSPIPDTPKVDAEGDVKMEAAEASAA